MLPLCPYEVRVRSRANRTSVPGRPPQCILLGPSLVDQTQESECSSAVVQATGLHKDYQTESGTVSALSNVSLRVDEGEFLAVMGASGSGKSTLLHLLAGLDRPTSGSVMIEGLDIARMGDRARTLFRRRRLGFVFQDHNLLPTLTAIENVALPAMLENPGRRHARDIRKRAHELLERVELGHRLTHRPQALSGGERQRVAIARALMNDPALLLADEPTGNLDTQNGSLIWELLDSLVRVEGRTVIAVTHEADRAAFAHRTFVLKDGRSVAPSLAAGQSNPSEASGAVL